MSVLFKELDKLTEQRYLRRVVSKCGKLVLYGYTDHCTFDRHWNKFTLNARGTVYELETGKVVAKAFPKFFNFSELKPRLQKTFASKTDFETYEKVDGSLGILFYYDGEWRINTRGSFSSDQALYAKEHIMPKYDFKLIPGNVTLLAEIIYPENKIIVDYGDQKKLVLLGGYASDTGEELSYEDLTRYSTLSGIELIKKLQFNNIDELIKSQESMPATEEGFVVAFPQRNGGMYRIKFKSLEYLKLASLLGHMTPLHFWKNMQDGIVNREFLSHFPEEFRDDADKITDSLEKEFKELKEIVLSQCQKLISSSSKSSNIRKAIGINLKNYPHGTCAFAILDGEENRVDSYVMKQIRPKGNVLQNSR